MQIKTFLIMELEQRYELMIWILFHVFLHNSLHPFHFKLIFLRNYYYESHPFEKKTSSLNIFQANESVNNDFVFAKLSRWFLHWSVKCRLKKFDRNYTEITSFTVINKNTSHLKSIHVLLKVIQVHENPVSWDINFDLFILKWRAQWFRKD